MIFDDFGRKKRDGMKRYHFVDVIFSWRTRGESSKLITAHANKFMGEKLFGLYFPERVDHQYIPYFRSTRRKSLFFAIMKRKEPVEFFETFVVFSDDNVEQFVLLRPEFNAYGD